MANWKAATIGVGMMAGGLLAAAAGPALAQGAGAPPAWDTLVRCAEMGDSDDRLACYDQAMRSAGYEPKPEAVAEARRRVFGLTVPQINILRGDRDKDGDEQRGRGSDRAARPAAPPKVDDDQITVTLSRVATLGNNRLFFVTTEGHIWEQIDDARASPLPKEGGEMVIKRGTLGSYFCRVNRWTEVRCRRMR